MLKLYRSNFQNPLFQNNADLEATCLEAFSTAGFTPRLRASGRTNNDRWVLYDHAPGAPWQENPEPVARLLRRLHSSPIHLKAPLGCNGSKDLDAHARQILTLCKSRQRADLERLRPDTHVEPLPQRCIIHGDPVAGNILVSGSRLTLIDWQCPALADPCEDVALFLSPSMQWLYRGTILSAEEENRFLSAYDDPEITHRYGNLRRWYAWRMAAYCLWRSENGAPDYATGCALETETLRN